MIKRNIPRHPCNIDAFACTPIEVRPARIIDLSRHGAKVQLDEPFDVGRRIHLDVNGDYYWGTVMWSEPDRIGVRFHSPVAIGVLATRLGQFLSTAPRPDRKTVGFGRRAAR